MIVDELNLLAPELTLLVTALVIILLDLVVKQKKVLMGLSILGIIISAVFCVIMWGTAPTDFFYSMLAVDRFAVFFKILLLFAVALVILASQDYVEKFEKSESEYYALLLISAMAMMLLTSAIDLISIFVALELSGISLYILVSYLRDKKSSESGLKYLLLGAIASAVLLYGMAFIFGMTGHTCLSCCATSIQALPISGLLGYPGLMMGIVLLIAGFGFKIASFPFQMWVPDVYEGAPTPVTAYLSVASKAAGFAVITRVLLSLFAAPEWLSMNWAMIIAILAALTMTVGNITALFQTNIKRLFGYSSIAQAGYLMVGLAAVGMATTTEPVRIAFPSGVISPSHSPKVPSPAA